MSQIVTEPESSEDEKSVEQWCKAIVTYRTADMKSRVDSVYLNSLSKFSPADLPNVSEQELSDRKAALQAELDDLHAEIASIAEMAVEHEIRKPVMDAKERTEKELTQARSSWLRYVSLTLHESKQRLTMKGHVDTRVYEQAAGYCHCIHRKRR